MPWSIDQADTRYDAGQHPWDCLYNGVPLTDVLKQGPYEQKIMAQAIMTMNPATPDAVIRDNMTAGPLRTPVTPGPS